MASTDLVLLDDSRTSHQYLIDQMASYLKDCRLMLNDTKSRAVAIFGDENRRKMVVDVKATYTIQAQQALSREESWVYLRIQFSAGARCSHPLASQLSSFNLSPKRHLNHNSVSTH